MFFFSCTSDSGQVLTKRILFLPCNIIISFKKIKNYSEPVEQFFKTMISVFHLLMKAEFDIASYLDCEIANYDSRN